MSSFDIKKRKKTRLFLLKQSFAFTVTVIFDIIVTLPFIHSFKYKCGSVSSYTLILDEKKETEVDQAHQEHTSVVTELKVSLRKYLLKSLGEGISKWAERRNQRQNTTLGGLFFGLSFLGVRRRGCF